jgi:1-phosphofructokinase/tagatose 6-phosphate kinase
VIVTVTLNVAIDRTLTVPNFQLGQRHRASEWLTLAGGKGINVARALKALDVPVVATGLAGGRTGMRVVEELQNEAILNDLVRIADESRTSTVVIDDIPPGTNVTEIYEWGPSVGEDELAILMEKVRYLARSASAVVFAGSLPRGVAPAFYAEAIRDLNRRGVKTVLDAEGLPLRLGVEAEPFLVAPNQREAESLVGQEFHDPDDFVMALDAIADIGAKNVLITHSGGCFALFREERKPQRLLALTPSLDPRSTVGSGDVLLAAFLGSRLVDGRPPDESLRVAVAAGAASTQAVGAGRFDLRELARLVASVELEELAPVGSGR